MFVRAMIKQSQPPPTLFSQRLTTENWNNLVSAALGLLVGKASQVSYRGTRAYRQRWCRSCVCVLVRDGGYCLATFFFFSPDTEGNKEQYEQRMTECKLIDRD